MRVYYDGEKSAEIERKLMNKWDESYRRKTSPEYSMDEHRNEERGIEDHVSDVVNCPMKKVCRTLKFPKKKPTKQGVGMMLIGIAVQKLIQWLYPKNQREYEAIIKKLLQGHVDIFEDLEYPLEIKASRKRIFKRSDLPDKWVRQIVCYMAMTGKKKGWIVIFGIVSCQISTWCVEMTDEEIVAQIRDIERTVIIIKEVVKTKDYSKMWIYPSEYKFCDYKEKCPKHVECHVAAERAGYLKPYKRKPRKT